MNASKQNEFTLRYYKLQQLLNTSWFFNLDILLHKSGDDFLEKKRFQENATIKNRTIINDWQLKSALTLQMFFTSQFYYDGWVWRSNALIKLKVSIKNRLKELTSKPCFLRPHSLKNRSALEMHPQCSNSVSIEAQHSLVLFQKPLICHQLEAQ